MIVIVKQLRSLGEEWRKGKFFIICCLRRKLGLVLYSVSLGNVWEQSSENKQRQQHKQQCSVEVVPVEVAVLLVPLHTVFTAQDLWSPSLTEGFLALAGSVFYTHLLVGLEVEARVAVLLQRVM